MHYFGEMLSERVPLLLEKYHELSNKKCSNLYNDYVRDLFFIHIHFISNEIIIKPWTFNNTSAL